jgi:hypothetical protein
MQPTIPILATIQWKKTDYRKFNKNWRITYRGQPEESIGFGRVHDYENPLCNCKSVEAVINILKRLYIPLTAVMALPPIGITFTWVVDQTAEPKVLQRLQENCEVPNVIRRKATSNVNDYNKLRYPGLGCSPVTLVRVLNFHSNRLDLAGNRQKW